MQSRLALLAALALAGAACAPASGSLATGPYPAAAADDALTADDPTANTLTALERNVDVSLAAAPAVDDAALSSDAVVRDVERALGLRPSAAAAADEAVSWDIAVEAYAEHERVGRYVKLFGGSGRQGFAARLQRGTRYEPMIRAKLREAGLPEDLYYLALVESGFEPHAYSRAAAVGLWQFMTTTARGVGLRVDWWVDERRDPVRATEGAIKYLDWLQREFGSLYLAAAAYNGGPGRVSRGLAKHASDVATADGDDKFFALAETGYLHAETENYVPQLIAAALIGKDPARWDITLEPLPPYTYDSVRVAPTTPLAAVAQATETPLDEVRELNGHYLRGVTPPGDSAWVRLPLMRGIGFAERFAALPDSERTAFTRVQTKQGQTLAAIAERHGRRERELAWYNPSLERLKSGRLRAGQTVLVPTAAAVAAALDVPDPGVERYGSSAPAPRLHVVTAGESLERIARRYGTSVATLKRTNKLSSDRIRIGQRLVVGGKAATAKASTATASRKAAAKKPTARKATTKKAAAKTK